MSTTTPPNPPAFPTHPLDVIVGGRREVENHPGMSLRDYFAAKAMQALIQAGYDHRTAQAAFEERATEEGVTLAEIIGEIALEYAEGYMRARTKVGGAQ